MWSAMGIPEITITFPTKGGSKEVAIEYYSFYVTSGNERDLDRAINTLESIVEQSDGGSAQYSIHFKDLFVMLSVRRMKTKTYADLEALKELNQLRHEPPGSSKDEAKEWLETMAETKLELFYHEGYAWTGLLDDAIALWDQLRGMTAETDTDHVSALSQLSRALIDRSLLRVSPEEIDLAVTYAGEAIHLAAGIKSLTSPQMSGIHLNQGRSLARRCHIKRDMSDLDAAIEAVESALENEDSDLAQKYIQRFLLVLLCERYEGRKTDQDLEDAENCIHLIPNGLHDKIPMDLLFLTTLAEILRRKHDRILKTQSEDVQSSDAKEHMHALPDRFYAIVTNLLDCCGSSESMFEVDETIKCFERLVESISSECVEKSIVLDGLCDNLEQKFAFTGDPKYREKSVAYANQLLELNAETQNDHRAPGHFSRLAMMYYARYHSLGDKEDITMALDLARRELDDESSMYTTTWQHNLAVIGLAYYRYSKDIHELKRVLNYIEPRQSPYGGDTIDEPEISVPYLIAVAECFYELWKVNEVQEVLDRAVYYAQSAKSVVSPYSEYKDQVTFVLGEALEHRWRNSTRLEAGRSNDQHVKDLSIALNCYLEVWHNNYCDSALRADAAKSCLRLFLESSQYEEFDQLANEFIRFLRSLAASPFNFDQQRSYADIYAGIASQLCALFLDRNLTTSSTSALQSLELCRTFALREFSDWHAVSEMRKYDLDLEARYYLLRKAISLPLRTAKASILSEAAVETRYLAVIEYKQLLEKIRKIPKLSSFERSEIQSCITQRCVIVVNIADWRSDAFIVTPTQLVHVKLPKLKANELQARLAKQWNGRISQLGEGNREYSKFLSWLWESGVKDLMSEVHRKTKPSSNRICWIGCGEASGLPFHAAGNQKDPEKSVMSMVISSYAPSFYQLAQSQARCHPDHSEHSKNLLIVTMPKTKGYPSLPFVEEESKAIQEILGEQFQVTLLNKEPSADRVQEEITRHQITHFACHGRVSTTDLYGCGLIFSKEGPDGEMGEDLLSLRRLAGLNLDNGMIAYLSACSTAENNWVRYADESLTVVCGFQAAGFRHVIGCLWKSKDDVCKSVSQSFYGTLARQGHEQWRDDLIASALHNAVCKLKTQYPKQPLLWAQFVHYGP